MNTTAKHARDDAPGWVLLTAAIIAGQPRLDGAACRDDPAPFRLADTTTTAAVGRAQRICRRCPAFDDCRTWIESLPARDIPHGVVAGEVFGVVVRAVDRPALAWMDDPADAVAGAE